MLELAFLNQNLLEYELKKSLENDILFYYFHNPAISYEINIVNNDWDILQYVSKNEDNKVIGFFAGYLNRIHNFVENLDIINFTGKIDLVFTGDLFEFFYILLIKRQFRKIVFRAIADNPAAKMYEKFIKKYNLGVVVGVLKSNKLLPDGKFHDEIIYEIYRENCLEYYKILRNNRISKIK